MPTHKLVTLFALLLFVNVNAIFAQTTAFTYQGRLTDGVVAASGTYEMQFSLYDALTGGTQQGSTITNTSVAVSGGVFTVQLDFSPATPFATGADRWLEIAVRKAADPPGFTTLTPRQQITSSPYSIRTLSAYASDSLSSACVLCVSDAHISAVDGAKVTGTVANASTAATAVNVSGVVGITNGGTGSSSKSFVDLSTDQTVGGNKTFAGTTSGTFTGNGTGLTNVPGTLTWQVVAGTSQQAASNTGYTTNNPGQVTVTLPTSPAVGDVVRVSGVGTGGWKIAQNAGQQILLNSGISNTAAAKNWQAIASSADGTKLVAVVKGGKIYTSTDSGLSWTPRDSNRNWYAAASSADGTKLVATVGPGLIYTSTDSGLTWTERDSYRYWYGVASSSDGTKLVAVANSDKIYTSTDSGLTWTPRDSDRPWNSVASSADGTKLVAVAGTGQIYTSTDSGLTWTTQSDYTNWYGVASSADGTKLVAINNGGSICTSTDSGLTWTPRDVNRYWQSVASSADGTKLVAAVVGGQIYTSTDSGQTWTPRDSNRNWNAVTSSSDGTTLGAVVNGGPVYTSLDSGLTWTFGSWTTSGTAGFLSGSRPSSIELQYIGGGQFIVLSFTGAISAS